MRRTSRSSGAAPRFGVPRNHHLSALKPRCNKSRRPDRNLRIPSGSPGVIYETIVTVRNESGGNHIAPMGVREEEGVIVISPFRPSASFAPILRERCAVVNYTDDVRVFAGCLTGRWVWPTVPTERLACN